MSLNQVATALKRVETVLQRKPQAGLHEDAPATARWQAGTRVVASHGNGTTLETDMPGELGGSGDRVTPGWLFRAGIASCAATSIAFKAAAEGIALDRLEVEAHSQSDTRGLLGMREADGTFVPAGPRGVELRVRIAARGIDAARLRALVEDGQRCSPIPWAVANAVPLTLQVEVQGG